MDDDRIDFSALDLKRNRLRYERMVRAVVAGARTPAQPPFQRELVAWGRAALAIAALLAFIAWVPNLVRRDSNVTTTTQSDPVQLVATWAETGRVPSDVDLVQTLGGVYDGP
jgi:hypothetical protein